MNSDTRGTVIRSIWAVGLASIVVLASLTGLGLFSQPAVASSVSLDAEDIDVTSNAGKLDSLTVQPKINYSWDGLDEPPQNVTFTVYAKMNESSSYTEFNSETTEFNDPSSLPLESDTRSYDFDQAVELLDKQNGLDANQFEPKNGETTNTTVDVRIETTLQTNNMTYSVNSTGTFTVSLTNQKGGVQPKGGQVNASAVTR